jgi:MFS family permease
LFIGKLAVAVSDFHTIISRPKLKNMRLTFPPALRYRDFRLLWGGLLISVAGSMMQNAAILWHIYLLTGSPLALGFVGLVRVVPIIVFSLISGVVADIYDRRKLMLLSQSGMAVCAGLLGLVAFAGTRSTWAIYVLAGLSSCFGAFDLPARQSLIPSLVPESALANAFSLHATLFQAGSIAGPALSGIVIAKAGIAWAYWMNAISFLTVIVALLQISYGRETVAEITQPVMGKKAILEGLHFVHRTPLILSSMLLDFFATFFSSATALLPVYAKDILHVGPQGYGWLYASAAIGALFTGMLMSLIPSIENQGKYLLISVLLYGFATISFGISKTFWLAFGALAFTGAADTVSMIIRNTIRQLNTPDGIRGRMVSINMIFFMGGPQLGELEAGAVASWFGAPASVVSGGIGCIISVFFVLWKWPILWSHE